MASLSDTEGTRELTRMISMLSLEVVEMPITKRKMINPKGK